MTYFSFKKLAVLHLSLLLLSPAQAFAATRTASANVSGPLAMSQSLDEELLYLQEEKVVTASRYAQPISEAPSNMYVITAEDIRTSGATDIPTILRRVPGIEVMQTTGAEFNVSIRGNNQLVSNKLLVQVDGRSIYVDPQGIVIWKLFPVTLAEIERIEVLRGPASALYGFNAFDGVVNVITKSPQDMKGTTLQIGGGEFGTFSSGVVQANTYDRFKYRLSVGWDQNQEWQNRQTLAFQAYKLNLLTNYSLTSQSKVQISGGLSTADRIDGPISTVTRGIGDSTLTYVNVEYTRPNILVQAYWSLYSTTNDFPTIAPLVNVFQFVDRMGSTVTDTDANTYNFLAEHTFRIVGGHKVVSGLNYRRNTILSNLLDRFIQEDRLGLYVQDEWNINNFFTLNGGVRLDMDTFINPTYSPRFTLLYKPHNNHTLQASVAIAYRPPTPLEENLDVATLVLPPFGPLTIPSEGSGNLAPERIVSYTVGLQSWFMQHRIRMRADLFFNQLFDLIEFRTGSSPIGPSSPINGGEGDVFGGEVGLEVLFTSWLRGFGNLSYQDFSQSFTGFSRRAGPKFKANGGMRGQWNNGLSGEFLVHYVTPHTVPISGAFASFGVPAPNPRVGSYVLLNLRGAYQFWHKQAEVAISVFNALNDRHREHPYGDMIGSRVMGWLTVRLPAGTFTSLPFED